MKRFAHELGLETTFFQTNHEGEFVEHLHRLPEIADGAPLEIPAPGAPLQLGDPRRGRAHRAAGGGGTSLGRGQPRGVAPLLGVRRARRRPRGRQGPRRLSRCSRDAEGRVRQVSGATGPNHGRARRAPRGGGRREGPDLLIVGDLVNPGRLGREAQADVFWTAGSPAQAGSASWGRRMRSHHRLPLRRAGHARSATRSNASGPSASS